jgi:hypothetical protein
VAATAYTLFRSALVGVALGAVVVAACTLPRSGTQSETEEPAAGSGGAAGAGTSTASGGTGGEAPCTAQCKPAECQGNTLIPAEICKGDACIPGDPTPCSPGICDPAAAACLTTCVKDEDCAQGFFCNKAGGCQLKKDDGKPCALGKECNSGFCADGVCCNAECADICYGCSGSRTGALDGTCAPVKALGSDPGCPGVLGCDGTGKCASCGTKLTPPEDPPLDPACTSISDEDECVIDCVEAMCKDKTITCPPGYPCKVECKGSTCEGATILCPESFRCEVDCRGAPKACKNAKITCSTLGPCVVKCKDDLCLGATVTCGSNECKVSCESVPANKVPTFECGASCDCPATPCL